MEGTPISDILGDQQAALVGQACFDQGQAKVTYGTGSFVLMNIGEQAIPSRNGMLTTVGYKFGNRPAVYALEGACAYRFLSLCFFISLITDEVVL